LSVLLVIGITRRWSVTRRRLFKHPLRTFRPRIGRTRSWPERPQRWRNDLRTRYKDGALCPDRGNKASSLRYKDHN